MRALSMRTRSWCAHWPFASVPYAHAQHAHQFSYFSNVHFVYPQHARKELLRTLSMRVRNWCVRWAYESGTDACAEHMSQELVCALGIRVRELNVNRAQSLKKMLSICIRNWGHTGQELMHTWAYALVSYTYGMLSISVKIPNLKRSLRSMLSTA